MLLTAGLGLIGVACIMLQPIRLIAKQPFARFGSKALASMFFCLAGMFAAMQREYLNWQAAALLFGFCLAAIGDIVLAIEPVLEHPERDKKYAFLVGGIPFLLAHGINLAVLLSRSGVSAAFYPLVAVLPAAYLILWKTGLLQFGSAGVPVAVYAAILSALCAAAFRLFFQGGLLGLLALPAALLFACSDTALFFFNFGKKKRSRVGRSFSWLVMLPYYIAQTLLACAVAVI